jgi:hypothetical protein
MNENIRDDFLKSDVFDFDSIYDHNGEFRYQYVEYLEAALSESKKEIDKLKMGIKNIIVNSTNGDGLFYAPQGVISKIEEFVDNWKPKE